MTAIMEPVTDWHAEYDRITDQVIHARPQLSPQAADRMVRCTKQQMLDLILGFKDAKGERIKMRALLTHAQARHLFSKLNNGT
jgi:hypothetical protein